MTQNNYEQKTLLGDEYWGEVDSIKHCEKRLPLNCHSFRERSYFPGIWFRDLRFRTWGREINHLNAHNSVWKGCFLLSLLSRTFDDRLSSNFHRLVILCICWDTPSEKTGLWQVPIVSSVFKFRVFPSHYISSPLIPYLLILIPVVPIPFSCMLVIPKIMAPFALSLRITSESSVSRLWPI